jgi:hypothetical protein
MQVNAKLKAARLMRHKSYELLCRLSAQAALERIEGLLSREGVEYRATNLSAASVRTPIAVLGIQPKLYSHSNWVGLNPFVFVSSVEVRCEQVDGGITKVTVRINRFRAFLWVAFWTLCSLLAARAMPAPGGVILLIGVTCATWLGIVSFLGGYLIRKEIGDCLKNRGGGHRGKRALGEPQELRGHPWEKGSEKGSS